MTSPPSLDRTVFWRPTVLGLAVLAVVAAACAFPALAQAATGPDVVTIDPVPCFEESELLSLIEKPTVTFTVDKARITKGQSATLRWNVKNADSVSITGLSGIGKSGSRRVSPTTKTTYTLTARNAVGTVTKTVTVDIFQALVVGRIETVRPVVPHVMLVENVAYDFVAKANTATWQGGSQRLTFGGSGGTFGFARTVSSVRAQDNKVYQNVLQVGPHQRAHGIVYGEYSVAIPPNGRFAANVGFTKGHGSADGVDVSVQVLRPAKGRMRPRWVTVASTRITRNGQLNALTANLNAYANKTVKMRLLVNARQKFHDDMVLWIAPRILK